MDELAHSHERQLRALMTASLDGDAGAYRALLERLRGHLRAYYRRRFAIIGHGPTEAEDLLQEALIAIHTHRDSYDPLQPFTPWRHAIARYKLLDYLRRTKSSFKDFCRSATKLPHITRNARQTRGQAMAVTDAILMRDVTDPCSVSNSLIAHPSVDLI
jgi:RNA polymerase sigma factor (sigma-70 family)